MPTSQDHGPGDEGPLAHAARVASERSYLDELAGARVSAFERASGARPHRTPKRLLVSLSHSIEKAVLAGPIEYPTIVVALFQEMRFFDREREVYERMAAAGVVVVVGFVEDAGHTPPRGVHVVSLRQGESLADEWSVVAVGPRAGAFLVATDQHAFDPSERDHEASREFVGRWGYSRAQAGTELARLRFSLGDRLDVVLRATIDDLLAEHMPAGGDPAASAGTPGETWATTSLGHVMDGMQTARAGTRELREQLLDAQRAAAARAASTTDPHSGVSNPDFLNRWSHSTGANPLPIGLALFDVAELDGPAMRADDRASYFAAHQVAAALTQPLGPVDAVVRMSAREFLVVVPGASDRHLAGLCDRIGEQLELASHGYPGISLRARVASVVTRNRPLPVGELHGSLVRLEDGAGPVDGGEITGGDRIVVSSTALHAARDDRPQPERGASPEPVDDAESTDVVSRTTHPWTTNRRTPRRTVTHRRSLARRWRRRSGPTGTRRTARWRQPRRRTRSRRSRRSGTRRPMTATRRTARAARKAPRFRPPAPRARSRGPSRSRHGAAAVVGAARWTPDARARARRPRGHRPGRVAAPVRRDRHVPGPAAAHRAGGAAPPRLRRRIHAQR